MSDSHLAPCSPTQFNKCIRFVMLSTEWVTRGFCLNVRRRLDCVRHMRCTYDWPFPVNAHVRRRLEKLRHLASGRLTCMQRVCEAQGCHTGKKVKKKGMVLYSAVSSPLDRSKRFTLSSPGRPVHSDTVLGFSWKHSSHAAIAQRLFTHISTTVYSQVLIYTAESTEAS